MKKASSGSNLDANLEISPIGNVVPYLFVPASLMPRSKKSSGVYRLKYRKKAHFWLVSLSVYPRSRRGGRARGV